MEGKNVRQKLQTNSISFFAKIEIEIACKIPTVKTTCETYAETVNSIMKSNSLSINTLKDTFFSFKRNKSPGYDVISFNVVKKCFGEFYDPLNFEFELSLDKRDLS